ncbi:MAG: lipoyl(octanoyl) transferase LipB [Gammaproteobacteria bacterium]|nr:lipoyl(octanoyl) transferase LipB [Gammaproteobacteria bacterium]MDE2024340.1 lipoyl(octanoyl) transferase LipB [Gammaproteobacteria bacterium]
MRVLELPQLRDLGCVDYHSSWRAMQEFTARRGPDSRDEIWFLEHPPVFTLGVTGKMEHVLAPGDIPVIHIDRGGQVTYHGPGQLVVYPLVDLKRLGLGVRALVEAIERSVIETLAEFGIPALARREAPGVYTPDGRKLASLGLRVRHGCTYHGLAFNVAMDLEPFTRINPCGYRNLQMTQVRDLGGPADVARVAEVLKPRLVKCLGYNTRPMVIGQPRCRPALRNECD